MQVVHLGDNPRICSESKPLSVMSRLSLGATGVQSLWVSPKGQHNVLVMILLRGSSFPPWLRVAFKCDCSPALLPRRQRDREGLEADRLKCLCLRVESRCVPAALTSRAQ